MLLFTRINAYLSCTILWAISSTALASKLCAICALNTPKGVYNHKFRKKFGANAHPNFRAKVVDKGVGLYPKLYGKLWQI